MKKKVTSTDIAHAAGVSQSTVSMILNKKYDVSFAKETVEKVENAAKEGIYSLRNLSEKWNMWLVASLGCPFSSSSQSLPRR